MRVKRIVYMILGFICLGLGSIGIVIPVLPTVPFYLATVFFFAQSSQRLHNWFIGTDLYKKHLESFVQKKGMTMKTKIGIMVPVTVLMTIGFIMMKKVILGRVVLAIVWICHVLYFCFGVKTIKEMQPVEQ